MQPPGRIGTIDQVSRLGQPIKFDVRCYLPLVAMLAVGCADARCFRGPPPAKGWEESAYRLGCADVLEVSFAERPEWDCLASVGIDGRLPLGPAGSPLADGATTEQIRTAIATHTQLHAEQIKVSLADARAGRIYLHGPEGNRQRTIPYRGPEAVVEFLWRAGAIKQGCTALHGVYVVRPNVAAGGSAEIFHVDVEAVTLDGDHRTDVLLKPSDQVYVAETRRSSFARLLPNWFRPFFRKLVGLLPPDGWPWVKG